MSKEENNNEIENDESDSKEVVDELSKVARNPKQNIAIVVLLCLVGAFLIFNMFFSSSNNKVENKAIDLPKNVIKPVKDNQSQDISIVKLPELPFISQPPKPNKLPAANIDDTSPPHDPSLPTQPKPLPILDTQSILSKANDSSDNQKQRLKQKNTSSIVVLSSSNSSAQQSSSKDLSSFNAKIINVSNQSDFLIASGKIIDAVLETAINSDTGSPKVRAIISRDVYSESGKNILIPKGSKIFGSYNSGASNDRVQVSWDSIYYNSGYILEMNATLVDRLGRNGEEGRFDPKNKENFSNLVMSSAFSILAAKGIDVLIKPVGNNLAILNANNIRTGASGIIAKYPNPQMPDIPNILEEICTFINNAIEDKTSPAYLSADTQCNTLRTSTEADVGKRINAINNLVNSVSSQLVSSVTNNQTQAQKAASDSYDGITKSVKNMFGQPNTPTITIPQGKAIKIQMMQNYVFPQDFTNKVKIIQ
jgi:type IV secretion system protein VirB10